MIAIMRSTNNRAEDEQDNPGGQQGDGRVELDRARDIAALARFLAPAWGCLLVAFGSQRFP
jgi:hypothetical protein